MNRSKLISHEIPKVCTQTRDGWLIDDIRMRVNPDWLCFWRKNFQYSWMFGVILSGLYRATIHSIALEKASGLSSAFTLRAPDFSRAWYAYSAFLTWELDNHVETSSTPISPALRRCSRLRQLVNFGRRVRQAARELRSGNIQRALINTATSSMDTPEVWVGGCVI